jgi:hypothetical protein
MMRAKKKKKKMMMHSTAWLISADLILGCWRVKASVALVCICRA